MAAEPQRTFTLDSRKGKGRRDLWKVPDSALARLRLNGATTAEIAHQLGLRSKVTVRVRLAKMGFPSRCCRFVYGRPITGKEILEFCQDFDLSKRDLIKLLKTEQRQEQAKPRNNGQLPRWLAESIYRQSNSRAKSRIDEPLPLAVADTLSKLRRELIARFCIWDARHGRQKVRQFLESESRDLPQLRVELKGSLGALRAWLSTLGNNSHQADILGWICEHVRKEVGHANGAANSQRCFRRLMFLWPTFNKLVEAKPGLLNGHQPTNDLVDELLAREFDTTPYRVRCAANGNAEPLDARTLGEWVRAEVRKITQQLANPGKKANRGRQFGERVGDTDSRLIIAADLALKGMTSRSAIAKHLYPQQNKTEQRRDSAKKFLRRHADAIKREQERLASLSANERTTTVESAKQQLLTS